MAIVSGLLLLLVALALWWLLSSLGGMVARAIEREGSRALGVPVEVGRVSISLRDGRGVVRDLRVANPEGFSSAPALRVDEIVLGLRAAALREAPLVVDEVSVGAPVVRFEVDDQARANLDVLRRHVAREAAGAEPGEGAPEAPAEPTRLVIRRLVVEEGRVEADLSAMGGGSRELALAPLRMRDVGGEAGAPPGEIATRVASRLLSHVARAVAAERIGTWLEREIDESLDDAGEAAKGLLRDLLGRDRGSDAPTPE